MATAPETHRLDRHPESPQEAVLHRPRPSACETLQSSESSTARRATATIQPPAPHSRAGSWLSRRRASRYLLDLRLETSLAASAWLLLAYFSPCKNPHKLPNPHPQTPLNEVSSAKAQQIGKFCIDHALAPPNRGRRRLA